MNRNDTDLLDAVTALVVIETIIFGAGLPLGSENYFRVRGLIRHVLKKYPNAEASIKKHLKTAELGGPIVTYDTIETPEQMQKDSDMIFTQITSGYFPTMSLANAAIATIYAPDISISRAGISHALKRLERYYAEANVP